jgi:hypothetical protein
MYLTAASPEHPANRNLRAFLDAALVQYDPGVSMSMRDLYLNFYHWRMAQGDLHDYSRNILTRVLTSWGYVTRNIQGTVYVVGLRLLAPPGAPKLP